MAKWMPELNGAKCIRKLDKPIITAKDVPYTAQFVFNAGVAKIKGKYVIIFRNDYNMDMSYYPNGYGDNRAISRGIAVSDNGVDNWKFYEKPLVDMHWEAGDKKPGVDSLGRIFPDYPDILRIYDPRIIPMEDNIYICLSPISEPPGDI